MNRQKIRNFKKKHDERSNRFSIAMNNLGRIRKETGTKKIDLNNTTTVKKKRSSFLEIVNKEESTKASVAEKKNPFEAKRHKILDQIANMVSEIKTAEKEAKDYGFRMKYTKLNDERQNLDFIMSSIERVLMDRDNDFVFKILRTLQLDKPMYQQYASPERLTETGYASINDLFDTAEFEGLKKQVEKLKVLEEKLSKVSGNVNNNLRQQIDDIYMNFYTRGKWKSLFEKYINKLIQRKKNIAFEIHTKKLDTNNLMYLTGTDIKENIDKFKKEKNYVDIRKGPIFLKKQHLDLVDKDIVTLPLLDNLFPFAINEGLENGHFQKLSQIEQQEKEEEIDRSKYETMNAIHASQKFFSKNINFPKHIAVKKIENILESRCSEEQKKEILKKRILNIKLKETADNIISNRTHLRMPQEKVSTFKKIRKGVDLKLSGHTSNEAMKAFSTQKYREIEEYISTPLFTSLFDQKKQTYKDKQHYLLCFKAFFEVCQNEFDEQQKKNKDYFQENKHRFRWFKDTEYYWDDYERLIDWGIKKDIINDIG